jgi:hypothetical protein
MKSVKHALTINGRTAHAEFRESPKGVVVSFGGGVWVSLKPPRVIVPARLVRGTHSPVEFAELGLAVEIGEELERRKERGAL